jgi:uncharacterized YigZ family protein
LQSYKTISEECFAEITIKRSRFIATVSPCKNEAEATAFINSVKKKYWDAKHNVYAFLVRENNVKRFSDDGEPHSTAGLPVMETIEHFGVTDVAVVVTRYFGGILLGTGGLVRAYSEAANEALKKANVITYLPAKSFEINIDYADYDILNKILSDKGVKILSTDFSPILGNDNRVFLLSVYRSVISLITPFS